MSESITLEEKVTEDLPIVAENPEGVDEAQIQWWKNWLEKYLRQPIRQAAAAEDQDHYELNYYRTFDALDQLDRLLSKKRFLTGDRPSEADVPLYSLLVRFDTIYYFAFRLNRSKVEDFPNLYRYVKDLLKEPAFAGKTDLEKFKRDYYGNQTDVQNPYHLIANGPDLSGWSE